MACDLSGDAAGGSLERGEVSHEWIQIFAVVVAGAFASKANLLFAESRMLRKIACALQLGKSAEEAIGERSSLHVVFANKSKGRHTAHGRLLSSAIVLALNAIGIGEERFGVRNTDALIAFKVVVFMTALAAFGTGSVVATNLRRLSEGTVPANTRQGQVRERIRDIYLFVVVLSTMLYGTILHYFGTYDPLEDWWWRSCIQRRLFCSLVLFRWVLIVAEFGILVGRGFYALRNQGSDVASYAAARIRKPFKELNSRQKNRYRKLRETRGNPDFVVESPESVLDSLGTLDTLELVFSVFFWITDPLVWGIEPDKSELVKYVTLDSIALGFILLKFYNDSVVESQLFMILARHATEETEED